MGPKMGLGGLETLDETRKKHDIFCLVLQSLIWVFYCSTRNPHHLSGNPSSCLVKNSTWESWEGKRITGALTNDAYKKDECTLSPNGTDRRSPASSPKLSIGAYHLREWNPKRQAKTVSGLSHLFCCYFIGQIKTPNATLIILSFLQKCPGLMKNKLFLLVAQCKTCKTHGFPSGKNQPSVSPQLSRYTIRSRDASLRTGKVDPNNCEISGLFGRFFMTNSEITANSTYFSSNTYTYDHIVMDSHMFGFPHKINTHVCKKRLVFSKTSGFPSVSPGFSVGTWVELRFHGTLPFLKDVPVVIGFLTPFRNVHLEEMFRPNGKHILSSFFWF